jgi:hypothetical protein
MSHDDLARYAQFGFSNAGTVKVRDLAHIREFATAEFLTQRQPFGQVRKYEISSMAIEDVIEMVAGLLTKITTTNDRQHEHVHRSLPRGGNVSIDPEAAGLSQLTSSVLSFHGKNVPSISILAYLSRIQKYCPLTYEVFLSLLVYFDRMTERVNAGPAAELERDGRRARSADRHQEVARRRVSGGDGTGDRRAVPRNLQEHRSAARRADAEEDDSRGRPRQPVRRRRSQYATPPTDSSDTAHDRDADADSEDSSDEDEDMDSDGYEQDDEDEEARLLKELDLSTFFVVDSFNIHRLVIAGVTCASKFFSDTFYTNSRYAKVCTFLSP